MHDSGMQIVREALASAFAHVTGEGDGATQPVIIVSQTPATVTANPAPSPAPTAAPAPAPTPAP